MKYINADLLHWFINYLIKSILVVALKVKLYQTKNQQKNYTKELLENSKHEKYTYLKDFDF